MTQKRKGLRSMLLALVGLYLQRHCRSRQPSLIPDPVSAGDAGVVRRA